MVNGRGALFTSTDETPAKPVPFTVRVNSGPPAVTLDGEMLVIVGVG